MRITRLFIGSLILYVCTIGSVALGYQQALIVQPVVDLIGFSFCKEYNLNNSTTHYKNIPICAKSGRNSCPRLHQLLYNEQVTIIESHEDEVRIEISHLFFQTAKDNTQHIGYWTHKRNVMPLALLKKKDIDFTTLPKPISFIGNNKTNQDIVTLIHPYHDTVTNRSYSAGTRFVRAHNTWMNQNHIAVHALMPRTLNPVVIGLPKKDTLINMPSTPQEQQKLFVSILKDWAHLNNGFIPYTWGGCSFVGECTDSDFSIKTRTVAGDSSEYYQWPHYGNHSYTGFDCTGIIARATQLAGMPYYFKNTTTLARNLQPLKKGEIIESGDLIWFSGHVIVIADTARNTTIEARGYDHGFGKIHELPLKKLFEGITTTEQLADAFFANKPLKRLNEQGKVVQTIPSFKILKMSSIWSNSGRAALN